MFSRRNTAERTAAQAWDYLSDAMAAAAEGASTKASLASAKASKLSDEAGAKLSSVSDEAWARANLAASALAGRRPGLPWAVIIGASLIGVALGWAASSTARAAIERRAENEELELAETAVPSHQPTKADIPVIDR